jgi:hypothetical protein
MNDTPINEALAAFDLGFASLVPAEAKQPAIQERLEPFRTRILARRQTGFSWKQISQVLNQTKVGLKVSPTSLRRFFSDKSKRPRRPVQRTTTIRVLPPDQPNTR